LEELIKMRKELDDDIEKREDIWKKEEEKKTPEQK
jgi:hypothetical protein